MSDNVWPRPGSFAERATQRATFHMADLAKEVDRLTLEHLEFVAVLVAANNLSRGRPAEPDFVTWGMATEVLRFFLGDDWTNENVIGCHTEVARDHREGRKFLKSEHLDTDLASNLRHRDRVTSLAECLYSLQGVAGIKQRIALMDADDLESALGEFQCAKILAVPQLQLRFIVPTAKKGMDYEAEIIAPGGRAVHCEIKTKKEGTELSERTVYNTLEKARKQLPNGKPGMVFLRMPEEWIKKSGSRASVDAAIAKAMRQSDRLVAIVLAWEEWMAVGDDHAVVSRYLPIYNRRSSLFGDDIEQVFPLTGSRKNPEWLHLYDYVTHLLQTLFAALVEARRNDPEPPPVAPTLPDP